MPVRAQQDDRRVSDRSREVVEAIHARLARAGHDLPLRLWDGTRLGRDDLGFRIVVDDPAALPAVLSRPTDLRAGEAFVTGSFDVEGSMVEALRAVVRLREDRPGWRTLTALAGQVLRLPAPAEAAGSRRVSLRGRRHSRRRDREAVSFHYDLGNDFFRLFLDRGMVYSCAYFTEDDDSLDRAQERKLELVCRKLRLRPGGRLLDIGCGWGSLVLHAARHHGVEAVGVTLSQKQAALARQRVEDAGLTGRVRIDVEDYREVSGRFDAVASVGMFEHVGPERFETYFETAFELTRDGGRFLNHAITTGRRREIRDLSSDPDSFAGRYVFPDGALAPASVAVRLMEDAGFELIDVEQLRPHYARTLQHWVARLEASAEEARRVAGEEPYRIWRAYMAGSALGFESGDLGVVQVLGSKGASLPLGRGWMLPTDV